MLHTFTLVIFIMANGKYTTLQQQRVNLEQGNCITDKHFLVFVHHIYQSLKKYAVLFIFGGS